jgi:hypothetical protein
LIPTVHLLLINISQQEDQVNKNATCVLDATKTTRGPQNRRFIIGNYPSPAVLTVGFAIYEHTRYIGRSPGTLSNVYTYYRNSIV